MARKILLDTAYTFTPSTATIVIPRYIPRERLILITDVTKNVVLYNFSDPTLTATSYSAVAGQTTWGGNAGQTTITLAYNTNTIQFAQTDKLQIMVDEYEERFQPAEALLDPTNKMRVTLPQSLIDTDFEYSFQPTKWEFFQSQNWNASVYTSTSNSVLSATFGGAGYSLINTSVVTNGTTATVSSLNLPIAPYVGSYLYIVDTAGTTVNFANFRYTIASSSTTQFTFTTGLSAGTYVPQMIVLGAVPGTASNPTYAAFQVANNLTAAGVNLTAGQPVLAQDTQNEPYCDGTFVVAYINQTQAAFAYFPKINQQFNQNQLQKAQTSLFVGGYYAQGYGIGSIIPVSSVTTGADGRTVTVTCYSNHNLVPGAPIYVGNLLLSAGNGPWYIQSVPSPYSFTYNVYGGITANQSSSAVLQNTTVVYARPEGYQIQRSGDGGIGIFAGNPVAGAQAMRQTRRYFRYQAGKGIQYSTSATFKPNMDIVNITVSGSTATITTDQDHGLQYGALVNIRNVTANNGPDLSTYNCTASVSPSVTLSARQFGIVLPSAPSDTAPGIAIATVEVAYATGSAIRCGLFDDSNGFFYEFDGTFLNAVRRNGTTVMRGQVNVCTGSTIVIGAGSQYTRQVQAGDKVIIRGMVYEVSQVVSDTVLHIAPAYRAASPALASGTAGLPFSYITAANSTTQTVTTQAQTTTQTVTFTSVVGTGTAGVGGIGVTGAYQVTGTIPSAANTTLTAAASLNQTSVTVGSATGIYPGQLVVINGAGNLPANTFVASTYVPGSLSVPLTQAISATTVASGTTIYFYNSPASGMNVIAGTMAQGIIANGTQVSAFTNVSGTVGSSITIQLYINQAVVGTTTASTLLIGSVPGYTTTSLYTTTTNVIGLQNTYGISPGMTITGTGVPGNCIVAGLAVGGCGVILNTGITSAIGSVTLTFQPNTTLYAITIATSASASSGATTLTLANVSGVQVGSFVTGNANIPINTFVTAINTLTNQVTLYTPFSATQGITGSIGSGTSLVFGSRIFVTGATNTNANGMWPVTSIGATTLTYQTAQTVPVSQVISVYGTTKMFAEDIAVKKYQVREIRVPQFQFNLDTFDGTGPTGFNMDLTKIQMIYIDYTWYGAGFIRWGARTINGDIVYAHKTQHGNREYLAFQRSGNLPGRFEAVNAPARSPITADIPASGYTMGTTTNLGNISVYDASRYYFPQGSGIGQGQNLNGEINIDGEIFYYTGVTATVTNRTTGNPDAVVQNTSVPYGAQSTSAPWATGVNGLTAVATVQGGQAVVSGGVVTAINVASNGAGYTSVPPVNFYGGGGSGAQARAVIVNGAVTQVIVTSGGYGYTSPPYVVIGANQLTGCFRESSAVASVNTGNAFTGTTTAGANTITSVPSLIAAQLFVGMIIATNANFANLNVRIVGISGTTVYVNTNATISGSSTFNLVNRGNPTATAHYAYNNSGNPLSNAWNTNIMISPNVQHWGVSAIMDGRFDGDISYVFTTPRQTAAVVQPNQTAPLISMRVSPSSSNGFARNFGVRDVILRMQAKLYQMDVFNAGPFLVTVKYNCASPAFTPALWTANTVGSGSLSQVIYHNPSDIVTGGDIILAFYANASGGTFFTSTSSDMTVVKDLGNSVYGGDGVFPDGPDVITVFATNLDTRYPNPIFSRISWTESQA